MRFRLLSFIFLFTLLASAISAGDLYLLKIENYHQLDIIESRLEYAHGVAKDRFVVELTEDDYDFLSSRRIDLIKAIDNVNMPSLYLISRDAPLAFVKSLDIIPDFEFENYYFSLIPDMTDEMEHSLHKSGFMAQKLENLQTPFFYKPTRVYALPDISYPSDSLADYIVQDSLYNYDTTLEALQTRYYASGSILDARDWIYDKFLEFGYSEFEIHTDTFNFSGVDCHNVFCIKEGSQDPDKVIVIGGHYDSINFDSDPLVYAPGADDNASGTAAVLEMARILKDFDNKKTIIFAAFSAEEVGLVGSEHMAWTFYNQGMDIEAMLNFDMIGYNEGTNTLVTLYNGPFDGYSRVLGDAAQRVAGLVPNYSGASSNSDHASFVNYGYDATFAIEGIFNYDGWHTDMDLSTRMDFDYFEQVARMGIAGVGVVDGAAAPTTLDDIYDAGNGSELYITWENDCNPLYTYSVVYGPSSENYTDTVEINPGDCDYTLTGLTNGQEYYFAVVGTNSEGYGPLFLIEESGTPYIIPRKPSNVSIEPDYLQLRIDWAPNKELDFHYYQILRKDPLNDWAVLATTFDTTYSDITIDGHKLYQYRIVAVDNDMNLSDSSDIVAAIGATFDSGTLFVEETSSGGSLNPSETEQTAYYDSIFADNSFPEQEINSSAEALNRSIAGQYGTILWFDDDVNVQLFSVSADSVDWFIGYNTNLVLAGWRTIVSLAAGGTQGPGDFLYDAFNITDVTENAALDFTGATGVNGWPDLQVKSGGIFGGMLPTISTLSATGAVEVIYTYNSASSNPTFDGQPVGVVYESGSGKRIALSFPLFNLTSETGTALIAKIMDYLGQEIIVFGDANGDKNLDLLDILFLIDYIYDNGETPANLNLADPNGDCEINLLDILYIISAVYDNGPDPVMGCVE